MSKIKKLVILGSTGSIGRQALKVAEKNPEQLEILGLAAGENTEVLREQIEKFRPRIVSVAKDEDRKILKQEFPKIEIVCCEQGLIDVSTCAEAAICLVAIVGVTALLPTIEAIKKGKDIAIASKEILVMAGSVVMPLAEKHGVKILPVDSEHSAIMQALPPRINQQGSFVYEKDAVSKIILTASGGAFRDLTMEEIKTKNVEDALTHPNWDMGPKITIDSATLMNKGLEVIEAHWLFDLAYEKIEVLIHPQSIVHSMVEYIDGSVIAQLGIPDMCLPIQHALFYPERVAAAWPKLNFDGLNELTFKTPDDNKYKCLTLAYEAGKKGGAMPAVLNAANERCVELFRAGKISFLDIAEKVEQALADHETIETPDLETIIAVDRKVREQIDA